MSDRARPALIARDAAAVNPGSDPLYVRGIFLMLAAGTVMSLNGFLFRLIESAADFQVIFWRGIILSATFLVLIAIRNRGRVATAFRQAGLVGLLAGTILGFGNVFFALSVLNTTVANAHFILAASPFLAAILARVLLKEPVHRFTVVAMTAALAGVGIMVFEGLGAGRFFGNLMAVGTLVTHAAFVVSLRFGRQLDLTPAICVAGLVGAAISAGVSTDLVVSWHDFFVCAAMGMGAMALGFLLFTVGARHVPAAQVALLSMAEVVLAPVWVWIGMGETPTGLALIGGAFVLSAIAGQAAFGMGRARG